MESELNTNKSIYDKWKASPDSNSIKEQKVLMEINYDDCVKRHNFNIQNEIHKNIRNESDYDDWEYGTEPIPLNKW